MGLKWGQAACSELGRAWDPWNPFVLAHFQLHLVNLQKCEHALTDDAPGVRTTQQTTQSVLALRTQS